MTSIPSNLARVPNTLASSILLGAIGNVSRDLLNTQVELSTGLRINRPSDDPIGASAVAVLDQVLERRDQRIRNLSHADAVLNNIDQALNDATTIVQEGRSIGLSQIGVGSDKATRESQSLVINAMIQELFNIGNRRFQDVHLFAGSRTAVSPFEDRLDGIIYRGNDGNLINDLGLVDPVAITLSGVDAFGAMSSRVEGDRDLDPGMIPDTRLVDLFGANGFGIRKGTVSLDVNGTDYEIDLSGADTIGDVLQTIDTFLTTNEPGALGPGGVTIDVATLNRIEIDLNPGFTLTFSDLTGAFTAADLGLSATPFQDGVNEVGADVNPVLTELTQIGSLSGVTVPLGTIRLTNGGQVSDVDLSAVTNIQELMNTIAGLDMGIRVEIVDTGDRLNFVNELSGGDMSIGEVAGGMTATELGVRSFASTTRLDAFNEGRGVEVLSGNINPVTGLPDPSLDLDFRVTVKDGRSFDVDLAGAATVADVVNIINTAAAGAGLGVPAEFAAGLATDGNGLQFADSTVGAALSVTRLNGSFAAVDLGLTAPNFSATLTGEDRATVAVDSLFSHLISLRDALAGDDELGIEFATDKLEGDLERLARTRAETGVRSQRVTRLTNREEDLRIQDTSLKSSIQDLDFAEAAIRLSTLQTQLQASLATTSRSLSLSLIDFLQ